MTYDTDPDDGEAAIERERNLFRIDDADERTVVERTESEQSAFAAKMAEWRRTGGIPAYGGPKAAR